MFTPLLPLALTSRLVATATDANGNTSEFSAEAAVMVTGDVALSIVGSGGAQILSWQSEALGYVLECTDNLAPPASWQTVTNGITDNGTLKSYSVTNDANATNRFYRLRWE